MNRPKHWAARFGVLLFAGRFFLLSDTFALDQGIFPGHEKFGFFVDTTPAFNDLNLRYAWTPRFAVGMEHQRLRLGHSQRTITQAQVYFLVREGDGGALTVYPGVGYDRRSASGSAVFTADVDAYWKNERYFFDGRFGFGAFTRMGAYTRWDLSLLVAPYIAQSGDLYSFLGLESLHHSFLTDQGDVWIVLRQQYQNLGWRLGASLTGVWLLGIETHF